MGDINQAAEFARRAGDVLMRLRAEAEISGLAGQELKNAGDRAAQDFLAQQLRRYYPNDAVLSEEATDDSARLHSERVWIIDPLDGTREYSEFRKDFAVHVALWERGELTAGAVALPGRGEVLTSQPQPGGLHLQKDSLRIAVSRTRAPELVHCIGSELGATLVPMGSAGYKICSLIRGEADIYLHAGGQYEWDSAAPVAVAQAYGLHASRINGDPLEYNMPNPYLPDLLICHPQHAGRILDLIGSFEPA
ncbi:3'(2'),5'-bisphosphate nucleotidase CysQ [Glutamicibacter soli]|uniref:3'(2'),5'-bisphosphate nucleotidase CysQ n=1 Tax=Glutamicibacter soli TaxID=453836 RepID=UPI003FD59F7B